MGHIPSEIVEETWRRLGACVGKELVALQARSGRYQPELTGFVLGFTSELRPDALGLALYAMVAVYEMFRVRHIKMRKARERVVLRHWAAACERVIGLRETGLTRETLNVDALETTDPFVLGYVLDAFTETHADDPIDISDDELWHMVAIFLTVVETLHEMAGAERLPV